MNDPDTEKIGWDRLRLRSVPPSQEHYDSGRPGQGGPTTLYVDGDRVASGRVDNTFPGVFSADETTDVGADTATGVTDDLDRGNVKFTGEMSWIQIDLGDAQDFDHMITPEKRYRVAMARQ